MVEGEIGRVFSLAEDFFVGELKYRVETAERPNLLVVGRGSTLGSLVSLKLEEYDTTVRIAFMQGGNNVFVACDYHVKGYLAIFTGSHEYLLRSEIEKLKNYINAALHPPPEEPVEEQGFT